MPRIAAFGDSHKDYLTTPKPSGYRAYHVNLRTAVAHGAAWFPITCELQIRTLLQDSWGELTHEDTYKPGSQPPPLIEALSERLASLTAIVDDIAQDLRDEIESVAAQAAEPLLPDAPEPVSEPVEEFAVSETLVPGVLADRDAAYRYLADRITTLDRPIDLASLAWEMQREFGQGIADTWLGHSTFKNLILAAVPDARLVVDPPAYVLPAGFSADMLPPATLSDGIPRAGYLLHELDQSFPLVRRERWERIYVSLSKATGEVPLSRRPTIQDLNALTRHGRDSQKIATRKVTRTELEYVAKALLFAGRLSTNMSPQDIATIFTQRTLDRIVSMGLPMEELTELEPWLNPYSNDPGG